VNTEPSHLEYKRARFTTALPLGYRYTPTHFWIGLHHDQIWHVGLTKFGSRLLGEMVDYGFEIAAGETVCSGQTIGWVEGFKALSELACIADGEFAGANPELEEHITLINQDPYGLGWLYAIRGQPDCSCLDAVSYAKILDAIIDKHLGIQGET
jgi:glycine cleavage system H protein